MTMRLREKSNEIEMTTAKLKIWKCLMTKAMATICTLLRLTCLIFFLLFCITFYHTSPFYLSVCFYSSLGWFSVFFCSIFGLHPALSFKPQNWNRFNWARGNDDEIAVLWSDGKTLNINRSVAVTDATTTILHNLHTCSWVKV